MGRYHWLGALKGLNSYIDFFQRASVESAVDAGAEHVGADGRAGATSHAAGCSTGDVGDGDGSTVDCRVARLPGSAALRHTDIVGRSCRAARTH